MSGWTRANQWYLKTLMPNQEIGNCLWELVWNTRTKIVRKFNCYQHPLPPLWCNFPIMKWQKPLLHLEPKKTSSCRMRRNINFWQSRIFTLKVSPFSPIQDSEWKKSNLLIQISNSSLCICYWNQTIVSKRSLTDSHPNNYYLNKIFYCFLDKNIIFK